MATSAVKPMTGAPQFGPPPPTTQQLQPYRWVVLALMVLTFVITFFIRLTWPPLIPVVVPILHMKMSQAGAFMSAFYIGYVITQVPAGLLADRLGARVILTGSLLIAGISTFAMGSINSYTPGFVLRLICGMSLGADYGAAARTIIEWFRPQERGVAFGAMFSAPTAGIVLSSLIVTPITITLGWRWAFRISGIIAFIIALVIFKLVKPSKEQSTRPKEGMFDGFPIVFKNKNVLFAALAGFGLLWVEVGTSTWVFAHIKRLGLGLGLAGTVMLIYGIGGVVAPFLSGWVSDKVGHRKALVIASLAITIPVTIIFGYQTTVGMLSLFGFIFGFTSYWANPHLTIFISEAVERRHVGLANGTANLIYQFSSVVSPWILGLVIDATGKFSSVWWIMAAGPLFAILMLLPIDTNKRLS